MSIQSSINQGILATAALVSQNPEFQEKKKEAAYEKKLEGTLNNLSKIGKEKVGSIYDGLDEAVHSGDKQLLYNQLKRFKEMPASVQDYFTLRESKLSEAQEHYKEVGDLKNYSKNREKLETLSVRKALFEEMYKKQDEAIKQAYNEAHYRNEGSGYEETNKELDRAEQIQANTNNFHKMLKNKNKVDVVGERDGK